MFESAMEEGLQREPSAPEVGMPLVHLTWWRGRPLELALPMHRGADVLTEMFCGLELAQALTERVEALGSVSAMTTHEQLCLVAGWDKVASWAAANLRQAAGHIGLAAQPHELRDHPDRAEPTATGSTTTGSTTATGSTPAGEELHVLAPVEQAGDEVALVLRCAPRTGQNLVAESMILLLDLPATLAALGSGVLRLPGARAILDETENLSPTKRGQVEKLVLGRPNIGDRTPRQIRAITRRAVIEIDPAAARVRELAARSRRSARTSPAADGMAHLDLHGPVGDVATAHENLDHHAHRLAGLPGENRGYDALRFDLAIAALTGRAFLGATVNGDTGDATTSDGTTDAKNAPRRPRVRAEIVVTGAESTLNGKDDAPGQLAGYGPITAQTLREIAAKASGTDVLTVDPDTGAVTSLTRDGQTTPAQDGVREDSTAEDRATDDGPTDDQATRDRAGTDDGSTGDGCTGADRGMLDRAADTYTPPAALRRYIVARDRTCRFPRCSRRAVQCDMDHTVAYPDGCTHHSNLGALCRRHHRLKQTPGWRLEQPQAGHFIWTTRIGRRYLVTPEDPLDPD